MSTVNKVTLVGNLGRDAELRYTKSGTPVCNFRMATEDRWNDGDGNAQERVEWHSIVLWGKRAEAISQYLTKGKKIYVEGRITYGKYTDRDGNEQNKMDIRATDIEFMGSKPQEDSGHEELVGESTGDDW